MIPLLQICRLQLVFFCLLLSVSCGGKGEVNFDQQSVDQGRSRAVGKDEAFFINYQEAVVYYTGEVALKHRGCADIAFGETQKMMSDGKGKYSLEELNRSFARGNIRYYTLVESMDEVRNTLYGSKFKNRCMLSDGVYSGVVIEIETLLQYCKAGEALLTLNRVKEIYCNR